MDQFTDDRGTIKDLLVTDDYSVTHITFTPNAVRGNHYHAQTLQIDLLLKGELVCARNTRKWIMGEHDTAVHQPNDKHAYKATQSSELLSICFGKRRGNHYEEDTIRLETPLL